MNNYEIILAWERANRMAERILEAYWFGRQIEQARKDQKSLKLWLDIVRENGYCYNGSLDEFVTMKI